MKRPSTLYHLKLKVRTTSYNYVTEWQNKAANTKYWQECEATIANWYSHFGRLNIVPSDPTITLVGIYWNELENYVYTKNCTQMFIAV